MEAEAIWTVALEWSARVIEAIAAALLLAGAFEFLFIIARRAMSRGRSENALLFRSARIRLGGYILAALEFLIVADILYTILRRTIEELYILAMLIALRIALSWFMTRELQELQDRDTAI